MKRVLLCDLDGTLLAGDSLLLFFKAGLRRRWISPTRLIQVFGAAALNRLAMFDRDRLRQLTYDAILLGQEFPVALMTDFTNDLMTRQPWHQGVVSIVEQERALGTTLVMITNTFDFLAKPIAEHFGFDDVHAVSAPVVGGRFAPSTMRALVEDRKAEVAHTYLDVAEYAIGLGNSRDDHAFMSICHRGVFVAPSTGKLPARYRDRWEVLPLA